MQPFPRLAALSIVVLLAMPVGIVHAELVATPTRMVVGFDAIPQGLAAGSRYQGDSVARVDPSLRFAVVLTSDPETFSARARGDPHVRYVERDGILHVLFTPNDTYYVNGQQYGPQRIGAPAAWNLTQGDPSVSVCIVDTGVRRSHEDIASDRYLGGTDFVDGDSDPNDQHGHGTFTTALATARLSNGKGIAGMAAVPWRHARVLDASGSGSVADGASGIAWCADQGADIISASLGTSSNDQSMHDAVDHAWNAGAVVIAASGNDGCDGCVEYPAAYPNAVAVGCTDAADRVCSFSSSGPQLDLVAPGDSIVGPWDDADNEYVTASGTSASAPLVAGAFALLKSYAPGLTNAELRARVESTALDLGATGIDHFYGNGLVRIRQAMLNSAPAITAFTCAPAPVATSATLTCAIAGTDPDGQPTAMAVDWGDGSASERWPATGYTDSGVATLANHKYATPGTFMVGAVASDRAIDSMSSAAASATVDVVANTAPRATAMTCGPEPGAIHHPTTCELVAADDSDGVAFTLDWGDGVVERVPASGFVAPGASATAAHTYAASGFYDLFATPTDDAAPPLTGSALYGVHEAHECDLARTVSLALGADGIAVDGVTSARIQGIPPGCAGISFSARATGALADVDICWMAGSASLGCSSNAGDETGLVPEGADAAQLILARGERAQATLAIPGVPAAPPIVLGDDDGEMDRALDFDFTDDSAAKTIDDPLASAEALPQTATLLAYGIAYGCSTSAADIILLVNHAPAATLSACAIFPHDAFGWARINIRTQLLAPGVGNTFEIEKIGTQAANVDSVFLGMDTDADHGHTSATQNGVTVHGELMWRLELRP